MRAQMAWCSPRATNQAILSRSEIGFGWWPAGILVIAGPIWLGDNSSVTKRVIERL
jgi:hypothetical protein